MAMPAGHGAAPTVGVSTFARTSQMVYLDGK